MREYAFPGFAFMPGMLESDVVMIEADVTGNGFVLALVIRCGKNRVAPRDTSARLLVESTRISTKLPHSAREAILSVAFLQRYLIVD